MSLECSSIKGFELFIIRELLRQRRVVTKLVRRAYMLLKVAVPVQMGLRIPGVKLPREELVVL